MSIDQQDVFWESYSPFRPYLLPGSCFFKHNCKLVWSMACDNWREPIFGESPWILVAAKITVSTYEMVRLIETMAINHFIAWAHKCLINEFPHTRATIFEWFFRWQRLNALEAVAGDEDMRRAIDKVETKDLKRTDEDRITIQPKFSQRQRRH